MSPTSNPSNSSNSNSPNTSNASNSARPSGPPGPPNPFDQQAPIAGVKKVVLVASGKGGVGKSTVAANLAIALKQAGLKVGLLDADIYGPSQPRLFGALNQKPMIGKNNLLEPIERYGIKLMSIGFLVDEDLAVVWRGPMLFKAMNQFIREVNWGELDMLIVDLPPGTGDVHLSLVQKVPVSGAVMVTTPQNLALADVKKAIDMFERTGVPILGVVENMAYFQADESAAKVQLFPRGDLSKYLVEKNLTLLAELPFDPQAGIGGEIGVPLTEQGKDVELNRQMRGLAAKVMTLVALKSGTARGADLLGSDSPPSPPSK